MEEHEKLQSMSVRCGNDWTVTTGVVVRCLDSPTLLSKRHVQEILARWSWCESQNL